MNMPKKYSFFENLKFNILSTLIKYALIAIGKTLKIKMINYPETLPVETPIIFAFWHSDMFMTAFLGIKEKKKKKNIAIITSRSRDGELMTRVLNKLGYLTVRGSSARGGLQALLNLMNVMKNNNNAAIAVDGPRGPYHKAKPGVILLAKKMGAVILPYTSQYNRKIVFKKSWDKSEIPLPFSTINAIFSEPIKIPPDATKEEIEILNLKLEETLNKLKEKNIN